MSINLLKRITREAKRLKKRHPNRNYRSLQREAANKLKKKKPARRKKSARKKATRHRKSVVRRIRAAHRREGKLISSLGSVASHIGTAKKILYDQIGRAEGRKFAAKKKSAKRKIGKAITRMKARYRKLC